MDMRLYVLINIILKIIETKLVRCMYAMYVMMCIYLGIG